MRQSNFRKAIPPTWHAAHVPVPAGEAVATYAERLQRFMAARHVRRAWAWTYDGSRADQVILAAPRLVNLPVILAHVVALNRWTEVADGLAVRAA